MENEYLAGSPPLTPAQKARIETIAVRAEYEAETIRLIKNPDSEVKPISPGMMAYISGGKSK